MLPLFDMLNQAQNGKGLDLIARQFNLSQQQAELAVEALMPAFSQGLKRNTADPYGLTGFLSALASGQHGKYFEDAQSAFSPQGVSEGNGILGHLFGSKEVSRAVAAQAAQATGLGQDLLKQMLPVVASMIMGGLFKQSTGQMQGAAASGNPLGDIIGQMMRQGGLGGMLGGGGSAGPDPQQASPLDSPFGKMLEGMFGGTSSGGGAPQGQNPLGADNPFGKMFEDMLGGGREASDAEAPPRGRQPEPNPSGRPRNPYDDLFGQMFETGRQQRDDYQKGMESIFDQFKRGMDGNR